uniref:Uncharacterized protein n=1 Tax=Bionectria ochroleuca TaxID=29856 RepID=A0A8H7NCU2_BIOOC
MDEQPETAPSCTANTPATEPRQANEQAKSDRPREDTVQMECKTPRTQQYASILAGPIWCRGRAESQARCSLQNPSADSARQKRQSHYARFSRCKQHGHSGALHWTLPGRVALEPALANFSAIAPNLSTFTSRYEPRSQQAQPNPQAH